MVTRTKNSFMRDGSFLMTPHVAEFFTRYDLEHDTANTQRMQSDSADMRTVRSRFGLVPSWTPKHLVDPYKLDVFAPRGHALQAQWPLRGIGIARERRRSGLVQDPRRALLRADAGWHAAQPVAHASRAFKRLGRGWRLGGER